MRIFYKYTMRLDRFLSEKMWFSRNKIQQFIDLDLVMINGKIAKKSSQNVDENDDIVILEDRRTTWVSRSAEKLFSFLNDATLCDWNQKIDWKYCLDVGASTGGFTQVLLSFGAKIVDAVEVGHSQLSPILQADPRVKSYEKTDIRNFKSVHNYSVIVCDASFVGLAEILPAILDLAQPETEILLLFKPQFEVAKSDLSKQWVVKNENIIKKILDDFVKVLKVYHCKIIKTEKSSLKGEAGNQEYWFWIQKNNI